MSTTPNIILVLDAMGVMYQPADDVADLLIPFLRARGCDESDAEITRIYRSASVGTIDSRMLWSRLGLAEDARSLDQQFSARYTVTDGLPELLGWCADAGVEVACISNDLAEWAAARADHFGLRDALASWTISATVGARKPTPAIYSAFLATVPRSARCVFVDDRRENVMAGQRQGMYSVWFTPRSVTRPADITTASSLTELTNVLNSAASNW